MEPKRENYLIAEKNCLSAPHGAEYAPLPQNIDPKLVITQFMHWCAEC